VRLLATPARAYDSRQAAAGKLRPGDGDTANPRPIQILGAVPDIPAAAVGIVGNIAVTEETAGRRRPVQLVQRRARRRRQHQHGCIGVDPRPDRHHRLHPPLTGPAPSSESPGQRSSSL
jgi:hypothetical protein